MSAIGGGAVLLLLGSAGLRLLRNHAPDSLSEQTSPDGRYRIVTTEEVLGFPGSYCIKQVYVIGIHQQLDRSDTDNEVFAGACDGLNGVAWDGARVIGTVTPNAAVNGVNLTMKHYGADGKVMLQWSGR